MLAGCGDGGQASTTSATAQTADETQSAATEQPVVETRTVVDAFGEEAVIPVEYERIACSINSLSQITCMLGGSDKIVCSGSSIMANEYLRRVFPNFNPEYTNDNTENILASEPDIFIGGTNTDANLIAQLESAGIYYVSINQQFKSYEDLLATVMTIGAVLGEEAEAKAREFCDYFYAMVDEIAAAEAGLAEEDKVSCMTLGFRGGSYSTSSSGTAFSYQQIAGGKMVTEGAENVEAISVEDIIGWAPEVIFCNLSEYESIMADELLKDVPAIADGRVYVIPFGTFGWGVNNAEACGLAPLWYATCLYPELFTDVDMTEVVEEFYYTFYDGYEMPEGEAEQVLAGTLGATS